MDTLVSFIPTVGTFVRVFNYNKRFIGIGKVTMTRDIDDMYTVLINGRHIVVALHHMLPV
jgi:hypothetical protein